jgi:DME family drug/metabolite transporter
MTEPAAGHAQTGAQARSELIGTIAVLLASAVWATSGLFVKLILEETHVSALALAFWRDISTFSVFFLALVLFRRRWLQVQRQDLKWLVAMGVSLGSFHVFWNLGVMLNGVAVATVQQAAMPAIVAVVARLVWHEPLTWEKIVAIVLTFAGTVFVSGLGELSRADLTAAGFLVGLAMPALYAAWNLFGKQVRRTYNPFTTLTFAFGFAALCLLPLQFFTPFPWPVSSTGLLWFAGLVLISSVSGFSIYFYGLGRLPASVATILAMTEIAFVAAYAYFLLDERLAPSQVVGAALVVAGVMMLSWPKGRRERQVAQGV